MDPESDKIDRNFIISEQRKKIEQLKSANLYNEKIGKHYKNLYLWRKMH